MTPLDLDSIYNLIPAVYRIRDAELALQGGTHPRSPPTQPTRSSHCSRASSA